MPDKFPEHMEKGAFSLELLACGPSEPFPTVSEVKATKVRTPRTWPGQNN